MQVLAMGEKEKYNHTTTYPIYSILFNGYHMSAFNIKNIIKAKHNKVGRKMAEKFTTQLGLLRPRARSNHQVSLPRVLADLSGDWLSGFSSARIWESSRTWPWCRCGLLELWRRGGADRGDRGAVPGVDMANGGHAVPMAGPCSGWGRGAVRRFSE